MNEVKRVTLLCKILSQILKKLIIFCLEAKLQHFGPVISSSD